MNKKCVALYSGGLDSLLSVVIMKNLNFDVYPVFIQTPFNHKNLDTVKRQLESLGINNFHVIQDNKEYIDILLNPEFGYGKNMNPCIDCKIFFYRKAKQLADEIKASFLVTGEVLGQRPMSQRSYAILRTIEKRAGVEDLVLRPLSAKCLPDTLMEKKGLIKKEKLFCIQGRSRKEQFELARQLRIINFESPAGGCLLTEVHFSKKIEDILKHKEELENEIAIELLRIGRHFRINGFKFVVSRKESETRLMEENFSFLPKIRCLHGAGGIGVFLKEPDRKTIIIASSILRKYSKKAKDFIYEGTENFTINNIAPANDAVLDKYRIGGENALRKT